ncbi:helix-turn-helix domain-containing protein [Amycolatopsis thermophila]|uniref:DNA-binding NarL/FixJ family response regulator n=1 Tax=Amycolatopsis thermophila TaxID=206084 RepID=A0ABU0ELX5_9PSEU|nr:LuxR C-terminal-related transcriptional regulator [Amycolatopsis thermophila]MDQ0376271.1 DNA-binding NarL/FixJ family response regulator [Amycolatopsis thermophila]
MTELPRSDLVLLELLAEGLSPEEVARRTGLSGRTVRRRIRAVCDRLGVATPIQAVVWAVRHGAI